MGRRKLEETDEKTQVLDAMSRQAENRGFAIQSDDARFLDNGESYNLHICMEKARMYQGQMADGLLGLGAQLILIKNHEEHGNFLSAVEALGLAERSARYAMVAARKFGNRQTSADFSALGKEKLRALTVLDDDSIDKLELGEEVSGIGTVDDIAKMTVRELRAALRKEKQERQEERVALEEVVRKKETTISALEMQAVGIQPPTKEQIAGHKLDEIRKDMVGKFALANDAVNSLKRLIAAAQETDGVTLDQLEKLSEQVSEFFALLDDNYQELGQDMEYIRPTKKEN